MNTELPSELPNPKRSLDQSFADKPHLRQRLLEISDLIDTLVAQGGTAHEAETKAIEQIRKLGNGILTEWAEKSASAAVAKARANDPKLRPYRKKELLTWHSTYGDICVWEQRLRVGRRGAQVRPFCHRAQIRQNEYSLPLQRALTDLGADESFAAAARKAKEHYGIEVPVSGVRQQTLTHAKAIGGVEHELPQAPVQTLITENDGCMLPIMTPVAEVEVDHRKGKQLSWREARLCLARPQGAVDCVYGATFGTPRVVGELWYQVAVPQV